ncbi:MAG TPA: dihydrofolate reductase family protein [Ardenticatenaceae bacterium]|jgi:dihydrofolate reductase
MSRLVVTEYVTVDGVMEDPVWIGPYYDDEFAKFKFDELFAGDALLMGRATYEYFAPVWINETADDDAPGQEGFADRVRALPKYVVSTTLEKTEWHNSHLIKTNVVEAITKLKEQPGQDILVAGSGTLVQTLMQHDLVDEYRLLVYPLVLGSGRRLFKDGSLATLKLVDSRVFHSGVLALIYHPDRKA